MVRIEDVLSEQLLDDFSYIHKENYPEDHLSGALSLSLLKKYYGHFNNSDCRNFVFYSSGNKPLGFIVAGKQMGNKIAQFKASNRLELISFFLKNPIVFSKLIVKKVRQFFQKSSSYIEADYLILSIVNSANNKGGGSQLLDTLLSDLPSTEYKKVGLYVSVTNVRAINFYHNKGFIIMAFCKGQYYMEYSLDKV